MRSQPYSKVFYLRRTAYLENTDSTLCIKTLTVGRFHKLFLVLINLDIQTQICP